VAGAAATGAPVAGAGTAASATGPANGAAGAPASPVTTTQPTQPTGAASETWCTVKPTLDARCTACHDGKLTAGAPMSLKTYADLQAPAPSDKSRKVFQLVGTRVHDTVKPMPPQQKLTTDELMHLDKWITAGAPQGPETACAALPGGTTKPSASDGSDLPWPTNCDATYKILSHGSGGATSPYMVPPGQEIHPQVAVTAPWGNEAVQSIAWRAITANPKVMHHWILYGGSRQFLVGWAPGKDRNSPLPDDVGLDMPPGPMTLDLHYNNLMGTAAEPDNSGVEICVVKKANFRPKTATVYMGFTQFAINIPAHAVNVDVTGNCTVNTTAPVTLISASPHAHTTARHMKFTVKRASGETIVMHDAPFDFNEQGTYGLDMPLVLNTGDTVTTTCTFTNDTNRAITFGEDTGNEMCFNFAVYYPKGALNCAGGGFPAGGIPGF
jgi:hypothetical protein